MAIPDQGGPSRTSDRTAVGRGWVSVLLVVSPRTSVTSSFTFEAAHHLDWHPGKCHRPHGHSYRLEVTISGALDGNGVVVDFDHLRTVVGATLIEAWDHRDLNEIMDNPTAELLAHRAWSMLTDAGLSLSSLRLWETEHSSAVLTAEHDD